MTTTLVLSVLLDGIVLFLLTFAIVKGYKKGFLMSAFQLVSWILCIILTKILFPYAVEFLEAFHVRDSLYKAVDGYISLPDLSKAGNDAISAIQSLPVPEALKTKLIENNNYEVYRVLGVETFSEYIVSYITNMLLNGIAIIATFVVAFLLVKGISAAMSILDHLPGLHFLNHSLGVVFGALSGIIHCWLFCLLITLLGVFEPLQSLFPAVNSSMLTEFFYNHNLLLNSLLKIFGH